MMGLRKYTQSTVDFVSNLEQEIKNREKKGFDQRKYARFTHNSGKMIAIKLRNEIGEWVKPHAFITDESFGGLRLLVVSSMLVTIHQICLVNVPQVGWVQAKVVWCKLIKDSVQEIGLSYCY